MGALFEDEINVYLGMIKANELRVGNHILYLNDIAIVNGLKHNPWEDNFQISFRTIENKNPGEINLSHGKPESHVEPIPLTPEILEQCGFTQDQIITNVWSIPDWPGEIDFVYSLSGNFCLSKGSFESFGNPCKYLHQLHNLIFALTGKELEFKPESTYAS